MKYKEFFQDLAWAMAMTLRDNALDIIQGLILNPMAKTVVAQLDPVPYTGGSRLLSARALTTMSPDGAFLDGPMPIGYAKFALRKGLPGPNQKRMAIENAPHQVDDFNGEITEGYGKGTKKLLWSGNAVIKMDNKIRLGKVNIHEHNAERAGLHYDFVAEGIPPGQQQFEVNIPAGQFKGRYAFVRPDKFEAGSVLVTRMQDRGILLPKPQFNLKDRAWLAELDKNPGDIIVEEKLDGSLANITIKDHRAIFRSHRPEGSAYYDKLPGIEWLQNKSRLCSNRALFPGPNQNGTVLKGELLHEKGAAFVGGVLNSGADKARATQEQFGNVRIYVWDIAKLRGKDVTRLPYSQRREMYVNAVNEIRRFNPEWNVVSSAPKGGFLQFYDRITSDPRGLPFSEGVVIKQGSDPSGEPWFKVKLRETTDVIVIRFTEGTGKYRNSLGSILVETAGGGTGEVGTGWTDQQRKWIWDNQDFLKNQVAEISVQEITKAGSPRAGVFHRWHASKSDAALLMYAEGLNPDNPEDTMYAMKTAVGWRHK